VTANGTPRRATDASVVDLSRGVKWLLATPLVVFMVLLAGCSSEGDSQSSASQATDSVAGEVANPAPPTLSSTTTLARASTATPTTTTTEAPRLPEIYVDVAGTDAPGRGSSDQPVRSVQFAVDMALAGDEIFVGAGSFAPFVVDRTTSLTVSAVEGALLAGTAVDSGAGIVVSDSSEITLTGFEVSGSLWGVQVMRSDRITLLDLHVHDVGQEAISVAKNSTNVIIAESVISHTGRRQGEVDGVPFATFGEGIYLGSSGPLEDGSFDQTHLITIRENEIFETTGEAIDVKSSVSEVSILGNRIHDLRVATGGAIVVGFGQREYDAVVNIGANRIWNIATSSRYSDGNAIWLSSSGRVVNNVIWNTEHRGIFVDDSILLAETPSEVSANVVLDNGLGAIVVGDQVGDKVDLFANVVQTDALPENLLPLTPENADEVLKFAATLG
jgi:hypothetical protein